MVRNPSSNCQIIRIKSAEGQPRIDIQPTDTPRLFAEKVKAVELI
jgi:hypothetical protein